MQALKILLIEDSAAEARLIRELLSEAPQARVELEHVVSLGAGLQRLEAGEVDVVLLDLSLPDSFGLDTLQRVRALVSRVPVIVLTGSDEEDLALAAVEKGAQDYLVKGQVNGKSMLRAARYAIARARALEALRDSQRFIHQVAELLYVIDPQSYEIDHFSSQMACLIGEQADLGREGPRLRLSDLIHPDDLPQFRERMKNAASLSEQEVVESEFRLRTAEGWCWLHARETVFMKGSDGSPDLLLGTAQVLADRPAADEALSSEITLLKEVLDALPEPIFVKDSGGRFLLSNAAHRRLLGVTEAGQVVGKTDFDLLPRSVAEQNLAQEQALLGGVTGHETDPAPASGRRARKAAGFRKTPLRDPSGAVIGLLAVGEKTS